MKSKKSITVFLFLVMLIQVLPLQQMAAWLFKNQITEELPHSINLVKANSGTDEAHPPFSSNSFPSGIHPARIESLCGHHQDEDLYTRLADDILTPPPNC